jgi:hypothetical protein
VCLLSTGLSTSLLRHVPLLDLQRTEHSVKFNSSGQLWDTVGSVMLGRNAMRVDVSKTLMPMGAELITHQLSN